MFYCINFYWVIMITNPFGSDLLLYKLNKKYVLRTLYLHICTIWYTIFFAMRILLIDRPATSTKLIIKSMNSIIYFSPISTYPGFFFLPRMGHEPYRLIRITNIDTRLGADFLNYDVSSCIAVSHTTNRRVEVPHNANMVNKVNMTVLNVC